MPSLAQRHLELIDEQWQANHLAAMSCRNVEDLVRLSIQTVEWINREEENWRYSVLSGATAYSEVEERSFAAMYDRWLRLCRNFLEPLCALRVRALWWKWRIGFGPISGRPKGF